MKTLKTLFILILCLSLSGCAVATKTKDQLKFFGYGRAKFPDGSEIESKTPLPDLPPLKIEE